MHSDKIPLADASVLSDYKQVNKSKEGPMNIRELIEQLEVLAEQCGDETEVRIAHQPSSPFELSIGAVEAVPNEEENESATETVVYIAEGEHMGYLSSQVAQAFGWRR